MQATTLQEEVETFVSSLTKSLPASEQQLEEYCQAQEQNEECSQVLVAPFPVWQALFCTHSTIMHEPRNLLHHTWPPHGYRSVFLAFSNDQSESSAMLHCNNFGTTICELYNSRLLQIVKCS